MKLRRLTEIVAKNLFVDNKFVPHTSQTSNLKISVTSFTAFRSVSLYNYVVIESAILAMFRDIFKRIKHKILDGDEDINKCSRNSTRGRENSIDNRWPSCPFYQKLRNKWEKLSKFVCKNSVKVEK